MAPIIAKRGESDFTPAPEGMHKGVCIDVVDLGEVETQWGKKHQVRIVWALEERDEKQRQYLVSARYTLSLHEKAKLRQQLETWRGRRFTPEELQGFDLERLIKVPCQILVVHNQGEDRIYANVQAVTPAGKDSSPVSVPPTYVRVCERENTARPVDEAVPF